MTAARSTQDRPVLVERFTDEVKLIARIGELIHARSQFGAALMAGTWELSYPETKETLHDCPF